LLQIAWDDAQRLARRRLDREEGRNDAANDLSELSEGEKEKGDANSSGLEPHVKDDIPRITSEMQLWSEDDNSRNLYIVLIRYYIHYSFNQKSLLVCYCKSQQNSHT